VLSVTFHGVRGGTPQCSDAVRRYGGNTACVVLESPHQPPIVLDAGTGLSAWAREAAGDGPLRATVLVSHLHLDHVHGLAVLAGLGDAVVGLDLFGPSPDEGRLGDVLARALSPPLFPAAGRALEQMTVHELCDEELTVGEARVTARSVPHEGPTNGYRVDWGGASVAYVSDHLAPDDGCSVAEAVLELADGVDLLIHDAHHAPGEAHAWRRGHSPADYAVVVAREAGARRVALFHHAPGRSDEEVDGLLEHARRLGARLGVDEVMAAAEGLTVCFGGE
jgi:ribonuclease BN (tRNA processing enzyme)